MTELLIVEPFCYFWSKNESSYIVLVTWPICGYFTCIYIVPLSLVCQTLIISSWLKRQMHRG